MFLGGLKYIHEKNLGAMFIGSASPLNKILQKFIIQ